MLAVQTRLISQHQRGFTLMEVLIVLSIIIMLYGAFAPSFSSMANANLFQSTLRLLHSDLKSLRTKAIISGQPTNFQIAADGFSYRAGNQQRRLSPGIHISLIHPYSTGKYSIDYQPNGVSDGFVIEVKTEQQKVQIHSNWLTGDLQIVKGSAEAFLKDKGKAKSDAKGQATDA